MVDQESASETATKVQAVAANVREARTRQRRTSKKSAEALARRASDVHVEPFADHFAVRLRIDGMLVTARTAPRSRLYDRSRKHARFDGS